MDNSFTRTWHTFPSFSLVLIDIWCLIELQVLKYTLVCKTWISL